MFTLGHMPMIRSPRTALVGRPGRTQARNCRSPRPARGLSLIEVLVAMVLGLFLLAGIIQVMVSARTAYRLAEAQARTQENGRYAMQFLARELRPSRSPACRNIAHDEFEGTLNVLACSLLADVDNCTGKAKIGTKVPLGYSPSATPGKAASALAGLTAKAQTAVGERWLRGDVLVSWGTFGEGFYAQNRTIKEKTPEALQKALTDPITLISGVTPGDVKAAGITAGGLALITDCETTDLFVVSSDEDDDDLPILPLGLDPDLNMALTKLQGSTLGIGKTIRPRVFPFDFKVYFICCVNKQNGNLQGGGVGNAYNCITDPVTYRPSLCRWSASAGDTQSLTMDVADLRVTYDGQDGATRFSEPPATVTANNHWGRVASARIELLVTSDDEVRRADTLPALAAPNSPRDLGQDLKADRRLYEAFNATVAIRSLAPWYPPAE
jgi:type II secretory pathway component PulJ